MPSMMRTFRSQCTVGIVLSCGALAIACSLVYPRVGLQHYLKHTLGEDATLCGAFSRRPLEKHELSTDEATATSRCMTDAYKAKERAYFYVEGPGVDSQLAWGMLTRSGRVMRFDYDSAPCGGPACNERFVVTDCQAPAEEQLVTAELPCFTPQRPPPE
jgi:hypothetical protein